MTITSTPRWSLSRGNALVPSRWQATNLDTRSNRVRTKRQQRCRRGTYTARAASDHKCGLADMTLRLLTCDKSIATHIPA